jgi:hypothetical protein
MLDEFAEASVFAPRDVFGKVGPEDSSRIVAARSSIELYVADLQRDRARLDWLVGSYLGADFKYDYAGQEVAVLLIELPYGARISNDLRASIDVLRGCS